MKIEYVVRVVSTKHRIRIFQEEDLAIVWARKQKETHGDHVADMEVVRMETIVTEEVLFRV